MRKPPTVRVSIEDDGLIVGQGRLFKVRTYIEYEVADGFSISFSESNSVVASPLHEVHRRLQERLGEIARDFGFGFDLPAGLTN